MVYCSDPALAAGGSRDAKLVCERVLLGAYTHARDPPLLRRHGVTAIVNLSAEIAPVLNEYVEYHWEVRPSIRPSVRPPVGCGHTRTHTRTRRRSRALRDVPFGSV